MDRSYQQGDSGDGGPVKIVYRPHNEYPYGVLRTLLRELVSNFSYCRDIVSAFHRSIISIRRHVQRP